MRRTTLMTALLIAAATTRATDPSAPSPSILPAQAAQTPATTPGPSIAQSKAKTKADYQGPTETDIRVAYRDLVARLNAGSTRHLDPAAAAALQIRLVKLDFVECKPMEENTDLYLCSVLVEAALGDASPEFKRGEIVMFKEKDAWRIQ